MLPPPRLFLYLDAVARAGSIRKAAETLGIASTALNRRILEAEEAAGTPLFERLPRGVRLTAAGEVLIVAIRRSLSDLAAASSRIEQLRGLVRGTVKIACAESVANDLVPATIARYQERHPGVQFQMVVGATKPLLAALFADDVDLLLAHDPPGGIALSELASVPQALCALMRPDHPCAGRKSLRLSDCQPYPVAFGTETFGSRRMLDAALAKTRLSFQVMLEASTVQAQKVYCQATGAICFQFETGARREVERGEMVAVPLVDPLLPKSRLVLGVRAGRGLPIAALSFLEGLKLSLATL